MRAIIVSINRCFSSEGRWYCGRCYKIPIPEDELVEMVAKVLEENIFLERGRKEIIACGIVRNAQAVAKFKNELELLKYEKNA